jgi:hypothetical protein
MLTEQFARQTLLLALEGHWGICTEEPTAQTELEPCQKRYTSIFIKFVRGQKRKSILKNTLCFLLVTNQRPFTQKSNIFQCRFGESFYIFPCLWRTSSPVYMSWTQTSHTDATSWPNLNKVHFCHLSCLPPYSYISILAQCILLLRIATHRQHSH